MWGIERGYVQERQTENDSSQKERERGRVKERMREREKQGREWERKQIDVE